MIDQALSHLESGELPVKRAKALTRRMGMVSLGLLCLATLFACDMRPMKSRLPPVELQVFAGASKSIVVNDIARAAELKDVRLEIFRADGWHGEPERTRTNFVVKAKPLESGKSVLVRIEANPETVPGDYKGQLIFRFLPTRERVTSLIDIKVESLENTNSAVKVIPGRPVHPTPDRIIENKSGHRLVRDELIVLFALNSPSDHIAAEGAVCGSSGSCFVCPPPPAAIEKLLRSPATAEAASDKSHETGMKPAHTRVSERLPMDKLRERLSAIAAKKAPTSDRTGLTRETLRELWKDWGGSACAIAGLTGGEFLGSVPEARAYQLRFPGVKTSEGLIEKRREILRLSRLFPELIAVSRSFVTRPASIPANDEDPDDADPDETIFNKTSFDAININTENGAWDKATAGLDEKIPGSRNRIPVAVIDADFSYATRHAELTDPEGKVRYVSVTTDQSSGDRFHGMNVSGLLGAQGNNGQGIAGVIWDVDLRLYDFRRGGISTQIHMLEAMVKAIDNEHLAGCHIPPCPYDSSECVTECLDSSPPENTLLDDQPIPGIGEDEYPRVINISHELRDDDDTCSEEATAAAAETNVILGQGVLYGISQEKEILWVLAAGNSSKSAECEAPAGLTGTFPLNTMTVASSEPDGSPLSEFSNHGAFVTIAAPGELLQTLRYPVENGSQDLYQIANGTSLAAPIVSGVAALILSQKPDYTARKVKQCIVQTATELDGHSFGLINAGAAMPESSDSDCDTGDVNIPEGVNLDVILSFDTTASMREEIGMVKEKACEIVNGILDAVHETPLECTLEHTDTSPDSPTVDATSCGVDDRVCFAVVNYEDYPNPNSNGDETYDSSTSCLGISSYNATYGSASSEDEAFRTPLLKLTSEYTAVESAIARLQTRNGEDLPESYARVFWEIARAVENDPSALEHEKVIDFLDPSNRNSLKVIINFGDDLPHDTDLNGSDFKCVANIYNGCSDDSICGDPPEADAPSTEQDQYWACLRPLRCVDDPRTPEDDSEYKECVRHARLRIPNPLLPDDDTGIDPGLNALIDCDGDDIDFQEDALMGLIRQDIRLIHIDSSENPDFIPYWSVWTHATGGAFARIHRDGTSMDDRDDDEYLPDLIRELLGSIPVEQP